MNFFKLKVIQVNGDSTILSLVVNCDKISYLKEIKGEIMSYKNNENKPIRFSYSGIIKIDEKEYYVSNENFDGLISKMLK